MKIHRLGSDYSHHQKINKSTSAEAPKEETPKDKSDAEDKVPSGRGAVAQDAPAPKPEAKKKQKEGAEAPKKAE